jgi:hypothetical protein
LANFQKFKFKNIDILANKRYYWLDLFNLARSKNYEVEYLQNRSRRRKFHNCYYENKDLDPLRNNVESVFSSSKHVQGLKVRSKITHMERKEMCWQIV